MKTIRAALVALFDRLRQAGVLVTVWGWLRSLPRKAVASAYAFVASPQVWLAGAMCFAAGWVSAFVLDKPPLPARESDERVAALERMVTVERTHVATLRGLHATALKERDAALARVKELEPAAAPAPASPSPPAKAAVRPRPSPAPAPSEPTSFWPKF